MGLELYMSASGKLLKLTEMTFVKLIVKSELKEEYYV